MSRKKYAVEQNISMLREAEVGLSQGSTTFQICKKLGITRNTYYRWRCEYEDLKIDQAKRPLELVGSVALLLVA